MEMYSYRMPHESTYNAVKQSLRVLLSYKLLVEQRRREEKEYISIYSRHFDTAPAAVTLFTQPYNAHVFPNLSASEYRVRANYLPASVSGFDTRLKLIARDLVAARGQIA